MNFVIIFQAEEGIKVNIEPSPLESDLNNISNDMWKSKNGLLNQNIWPIEI